jgi:hypothetical protein
VGVVSVAASRITGLHTETVREYLRVGRIKGRQIGRTWIVEERDLRGFMATPRKKTGRPQKETVTPALVEYASAYPDAPRKTLQRRC